MAIKTVKKTQWFPIFRAGTHTDSAGVAREFDEAQLDKIVQFNASRLDQVPAVVGHPKTDDPAWGWLAGLKKDMVDGVPTLYAQLKDAVVEFYDAVNAGMYKNLSISLQPDLTTLKHIGFLGAAAPAVEGLGPVQFTAGEGSDLVVEFAQDNDWRLKGVLRTFMNTFQRVRDFLVEKYDADTANKVITSESLGWAAEDIGEIDTAGGTAFSAPATPITKGEDPMDALLKQENEALKAQVAEFSKNQARLTAVEQENATLKAATEATAKKARGAEFSAYTAGLVKDGRLLPANAPIVEGILELLHTAQPVQFSAEKTATPMDAMKELLGSYPARINFSRVADKGAAGGQPDNTNAQDIANRAVSFQKSQAEKGITVTIAQAVEAVTKA